MTKSENNSIVSVVNIVKIYEFMPGQIADSHEFMPDPHEFMPRWFTRVHARTKKLLD